MKNVKFTSKVTGRQWEFTHDGQQAEAFVDGELRISILSYDAQKLPVMAARWNEQLSKLCPELEEYMEVMRALHPR